MHLIHTYPIFVNRVAPFFVGKDARRLEPLLWELYRHEDNYKYQGLALWVCVAAAEFAILDLLGKLADSRSARCSAACAGGRSPSTGPAATGATPRRRRSNTSGRWSPRRAPGAVSSASAGG
jgi:hypothetical protein